MTTLSDRIRDQLKELVAPCQSCGNPRRTITALAKTIGQPASTVGKYLAGGKPSVALLDAAEGYLRANEPALTQDEAIEALTS